MELVILLKNYYILKRPYVVNKELTVFYDSFSALAEFKLFILKKNEGVFYLYRIEELITYNMN